MLSRRRPPHLDETDAAKNLFRKPAGKQPLTLALMRTLDVARTIALQGFICGVEETRVWQATAPIPPLTEEEYRNSAGGHDTAWPRQRALNRFRSPYWTHLHSNAGFVGSTDRSGGRQA
jgi:hypothetical protein